MFADLLAQYERGEIPHNAATDGLAQALRAILAGTPPAQALGLAKKRGRPRKVPTPVEWEARRFLAEQIQARGGARGARERALEAAERRRFGGRRLKRRQLEQFLKKLASLATTDEWRLTSGEIQAIRVSLAVTDEWRLG